MPQLGLGSSLRKGGGVGRTYVKDGLKLYMPYRGSDASEVDFVGTGSTSFDGTGDYILCGTTGLPTGDTERTIMIWVKQGTALGDGRGIFGWGETGGSETDETFEFYNYNGGISVHYAGGSSGGSTLLGQNVWRHIAATHDGTTVSVYVDGVLDHVSAKTLSTVADFCRIGSNNYSSSPSELFTGSLKNAAVWNRALTATEIQNVMYKSYNEVSGRLASGLVSWWALDASNLRSNLVNTWTNSVYDWQNWDSSGADINQFDSDGTLSYAYTNTIAFVSGKRYQLDIDYDNTSGSLVNIMIADANGANPVVGTQDGFNFSGTELADGTTTFVFESTWGTKRLNLQENTLSVNNSATFVLREISIEDLKGSNDGTVYGAVTDEDLYGGDTPVKPRAIDNAPTVQADAIGAGSASFDGTDDYIAIADSDDLSFGSTTADNPFSITAWINMDDATSFPIATKGIYNSTGEWHFKTETDDKLWFALFDESVADTYEIAYTTAVLTAYEGQWVHVAGTYTGVGGTSANAGIKLYVNGVAEAMTLTGGGTYVAMENLAADVHIGRLGSTYADGNIAQAGIWKGVLTQAEIQSVMEKTFEELTATDKSILGSNLVTSWANRGAVPYETFTSSGANITAAHNTTGSSQAHALVSLTIGTLYKITVDLTLDSGTAPFVGFQDSVGGSDGSVVAHLLSAGENTIYTVGVANDNYLLIDNNSTTTEFSAVVTLKEVTHDLVSYWALDEQFAPVLNFDGTNDFVATSADSTGGLATYSYWSRSTNNARQAIFGHGSNVKGAFYPQFSSQKPLLYLHAGGYHQYWAAQTASYDGVWHHWVVVLNFSDIASSKLYIDGALISVDSTATATSATAYSQGLTIGAYQFTSSGGSDLFIGSIKNFAVYDTELTSSQILTQYNLGIEGDRSSDSDLVGYWEMDSASTVTDLSSNSNNGTVTNAGLGGIVLDKTSNNNDGTLI